jgi:exopolysaccharide production protein ExoZ
MKPGERLAALEGLRGFAAFLVFLVHAFGLLLARVYGIDADHAAVLGDTNFARAAAVFFFRSHYGVDLFFVLSGLLMADLALRRWPGTGRFLARRLTRIYPAYAVAAAVAAVVTVAWFGGAFTPATIAGNVFLLQGFFTLGIAALNPVSWSLSYEMAFYLVVPLLALAWRGHEGQAPPNARFTLAIALIAIVVAAALVPIDKGIYFAYFALFIPGIALGLLDDAQRERAARAVPLAVVALAWLAFTLAVKLGLLSNLQPAYYCASGIACGLVVLKACDTTGALARALSSPVPRWLGKYSYSFFLIHFVVVHAWGEALARLIAPSGSVAYAALFLAGALGLSLVAARLLYAVAEGFYFRLSRR